LDVHRQASATIEQSMALHGRRFGRLLQQEADIREWEVMLSMAMTKSPLVAR
jgi:hypothetical protein